jgi:hypothetical protein
VFVWIGEPPTHLRRRSKFVEKEVAVDFINEYGVVGR